MPKQNAWPEGLWRTDESGNIRENLKIWQEMQDIDQEKKKMRVTNIVFDRLQHEMLISSL